MEQVNGVDNQVIQYIDQMQIPGMPGTKFASMAKSGDPYDTQVIQTIQNMLQRGVPATKFKNTLMQIMKPEVEKAVNQGLDQQQIAQNLQANPHIITQYVVQAAQRLLGPTGQPVQTPPASSQPRIGGGLRKA